LLLGEHDFRNFSSAKVNTVKSWSGKVDEYSRARAATALSAMVQERMAGANVARTMQRAMEK